MTVLDSLEPALLAQHVEAVVKLVDDANAFVRAAALGVLCRLGEEQLAPHCQAIVRRMEDADPKVQSAAYEALAIADPAGTLAAHSPLQSPLVRGLSTGALSPGAHLTRARTSRYTGLIQQQMPRDGSRR